MTRSTKLIHSWFWHSGLVLSVGMYVLVCLHISASVGVIEMLFIWAVGAVWLYITGRAIAGTLDALENVGYMQQYLDVDYLMWSISTIAIVVLGLMADIYILRS